MNHDFQTKILDKCRSLSARVAFPEADDPRVEQAITVMLKERILSSAVVWSRDFKGLHSRVLTKVPHHNSDCLVDGSKCFSADREALKRHVQAYFERKRRNVDASKLAGMTHQPLIEAGFLLHNGGCHAVIAGSVATTAEVIRSALMTIGMADGVHSVCGAFLLVKGDSILIFTDSAVIIEPSVEQLVDIAASGSMFYQRVTGEKSKVAFLSFSTRDSAAHQSVDRIKFAVKNFKERFPQVIADGEMQFDAAFVKDVGLRKAPGSPVAGSANVFVFPDLNAGNIGYKIAQWMGGYSAYGPILLGLKRPFTDLSRGANQNDIVMTTSLAIINGDR